MLADVDKEVTLCIQVEASLKAGEDGGSKAAAARLEYRAGVPDEAARTDDSQVAAELQEI